jgi:hypothetical protein
MSNQIKKTLLAFFITFSCFAQENQRKDSIIYKKKVLESMEVDFLMSYYEQDGTHAAVTGGLGTEHLTDITPTIVVQIPLNEDDILTVDFGISAYTSASSSNLDPFDASGASGGREYENKTSRKKDDDKNPGSIGPAKGSPWIESTGASLRDTWVGTTIKYSHSSDDRNTIWGANTSVSAEYDYFSLGFVANISKLFNEKNTEFGLSGQVFIDKWLPRYPTELDSYLESNSNLNNGFFANQNILNQQGNAIDKNSINAWSPFKQELLNRTDRNTYSLSFTFSQILSENAQVSVFADVVQQQGWLANPMQRVYFADKANFYIGNASSIPNYTSSTNTDVFHLADDIERLPESRLKIPIGTRLNYYLSENLTLRTYYRYYQDDWGLNAHTAEIELPIKFAYGKFTLYPNYRYYQQSDVHYFAPYETHLSTSEFYTSDYDLSQFTSHQYGLGFKYTDIFAKFKIANFGMKSLDLRYSNYNRSDGLQAGIINFGVKFVME